MSSFTSPLVVEPISKNMWVLVEPFEYHVGHLGSDNVITVPAGFPTDFASSPQFAWSVIPPWGDYGKAAVIHDFLYVVQTRSRKESDNIFLEAMSVLKVNQCKKYIMYWYVRSLGWIAWKSRKKAVEESREKFLK